MMKNKKNYDETAQIGGILANLSLNQTGNKWDEIKTPSTAKKPPRGDRHATKSCKEVGRSLFNSNDSLTSSSTHSPHEQTICHNKSERLETGSESNAETSSLPLDDDLDKCFSTMIKTPSPGSAAYSNARAYPLRYPYPYPGRLRNNVNREGQNHPSHVHVPQTHGGNMNITSPLETSPFSSSTIAYSRSLARRSLAATPCSTQSTSTSPAVSAVVDSSSESSAIITEAMIYPNAMVTPLVNKGSDGFTFMPSSPSSSRSDRHLFTSPSATVTTDSFLRFSPKNLSNNDDGNTSDTDYNASSKLSCSRSREKEFTNIHTDYKRSEMHNSDGDECYKNSDEDCNSSDEADESISPYSITSTSTENDEYVENVEEEDDHTLDASYITREEYIPYGRQVDSTSEVNEEESIFLSEETENDCTFSSDDTESESEDEMSDYRNNLVDEECTNLARETSAVRSVDTQVHSNAGNLSPTRDAEVVILVDECDEDNIKKGEEAVIATIIDASDEVPTTNVRKNQELDPEIENLRLSRQTSSTSMGSRKMVRRGKWTLGTRIGEGSFGIVHVGMNNLTGKLMAVKILKIPSKSSHESLEGLRREINLMKSFEHPNIVRYIGCEIDKKKGVIHVFQDWIPGGSVTSLLKKFGPFPPPVVRCYMYQVLTGLNYLHSNRIIHRDIKGGNILVNDEGIVKLADFGASKRLHITENVTMMDADNFVESMGMRGTPYFMAPEVFQEKYGTKADVWSCACVVHQMCTTNPPWKGLGLNSPAKLYLYISKHEGPPPLNCPPQNVRYTGKNDTITELNAYPSLTNLLEQCFKRDPSTRPSVQTLLMHPFFTDYDPSDTSTLEEDESITSSMIGTIRSTIASPITSSFSPLKLAAWKQAREEKKTELICDKHGWPSWAKGKDSENRTVDGKKKNPFAK